MDRRGFIKSLGLFAALPLVGACEKAEALTKPKEAELVVETDKHVIVQNCFFEAKPYPAILIKDVRK